MVASMTGLGVPPILYCDNHLLVAVKPSNIPAQADASGDVDMLSLMKMYVKETYQKPGAVFLGLVHRLDRPVGGVMAFARTSKAAARLCEQLRCHEMCREYLAVVKGTASEAAALNGVICKEDGTPQAASLSYQRLMVAESLSLLWVSLATGRKHQIRIQLAEAGLPIWGDNRHGGGKPGEQIALFGARLTLNHPTTRQRLVFSAQPPEAYPWYAFSGWEMMVYPPNAGDSGNPIEP